MTGTYSELAAYLTTSEALLASAIWMFGWSEEEVLTEDVFEFGISVARSKAKAKKPEYWAARRRTSRSVLSGVCSLYRWDSKTVLLEDEYTEAVKAFCSRQIGLR